MNKEEGEKTETGAARVRRVLIGPLSGLQRPRGVTEAEWRAGFDKVVGKLSYMSEAGLAGLVDLVLGQSGVFARAKVVRPVCPHPSEVIAWAVALELPPVEQSDYAASVVRSVMGRRAYDGGYGVELLRHARKFGPPPGSYSVTRLQDEARQNARRRADLRAQAEGGRSLDPVHARWLEAWHADAALVERLIAEGDERRAARDAA